MPTLSRNISRDYSFTDYHLGTELLKRKFTPIRTLCKNKTFIPAELQPRRNKEVFPLLLDFQSHMTLISYTPKKNKSVLLLSSMHFDDKVSPEEHKKRDIIIDYNKTKGGLDTSDKLALAYTCKRGTSR